MLRSNLVNIAVSRKCNNNNKKNPFYYRKYVSKMR